MVPPGNIEALAEGIVAAHRRWPTGTYLLWYPIKSRDGPDRVGKALQRAGIDKGLRVEIAVSAAAANGGLCACGVIAINPPWQLEVELRTALTWLARALGPPPGRHRLDWLVPE